tara:strand:+ start:1542 stop:2408 length:867 start_codon:yes stop_codon:yes gene_type:complete
MPELPEVEVVKRSLEKYILNKRILKIVVKNKNLRYPVPENLSKRVANIKIQKVRRISKYLVLEFKDELFLLIHLGMSGTLHLINSKNNYRNTNLSFYHSKNLPEKHNHIFLNFYNFTIIFNDPRRFGFFKLIIGHSNLVNYFKNLGPDPFEKNFNFKYVKEYLYKKNKNIKNTLIDQKFISGIGNIYASEILNYSKINPLKTSGNLKNNEINKIIFYTKKVLNLSIKKGGTTINNFQSVKGNKGSYQKEFRAYNQESKRCKNSLCLGTIIKVNLSNRSTYMCNICQKK